MACDDEVIPLQERIETVGDDADLREIYDPERHLLYVACTRTSCQWAGTGRPSGELQQGASRSQHPNLGQLGYCRRFGSWRDELGASISRRQHCSKPTLWRRR
jgi:hypothetical protein